MSEGVTWNYTTWLNIVFLVLAAVLVVRFVRTGGMAMLRMMGGATRRHDHDHHGHDHDHEDGGRGPQACEHHTPPAPHTH